MFPTPINYQIVITSYLGDRIRRLADLRRLFPYEQMPGIKKILDGYLIKAYSTEEAFKLINALEENFSFLVSANYQAIGPMHNGCASIVIPEDWMRGMSLLDYQEQRLKKDER